MKNLYCSTRLLVLLLLSGFCGFAQQQLTLVIQQQPALHPTDSLYVAGNFNGWQPGNSAFAFSTTNGRLQWTGRLPAGELKFKITRGKWSKVETDSLGKDIADRQLLLAGDTTLPIIIGGWGDDFEQVPKPHTASQNVSLLDSAFPFAVLRRTHPVWVYTPPGYSNSKKKYPVIYMLDGQNLFDDALSGFGEWGVDECLDSMSQQGSMSFIVVGIGSGEKRLTEYNPYYFERFGAGEGDAFLNGIIHHLKPVIDSKYRTLTNKENTTIAGSSMGGLIACYAAWQYAEVFGKAGIFSPAFWTAPAINALTDTVGSRLTGKYFFFMGEQEGKNMVEKMQLVAEKAGLLSSAMLLSITDADGQHNEATWRRWFPYFIKWISANGWNLPMR
jgi:predicted alpha/beta superfamily hydrolase